jgi:hypothetical protein
MANVLDVVLEIAKSLSPTPSRKIAEASKALLEAETKQAEVEAAKIQAEFEAGPSEPTETEPAVVEKKRQSKLRLKRLKLLLSKLQKKALITSFVMLRGKDFLKKRS